MNWTNRIVGYGTANPAELIMNPLNIRVHTLEQQDAMRAILATVGWVDDVIVNRSSGTLIDGHLRVSLALERGEAAIPVSYVELTEAEERLALATFDRIGTLATIDTTLLGALMGDLSTDHTVLGATLASFAEAAGVVDLSEFSDPDLLGLENEGDDLAGDDPQLAPADTSVKVGDEITFALGRAEYETWLETVRFDHGFGYKDVLAAILNMLELDHVA